MTVPRSPLSREPIVVHGSIQVARGALTDGDPLLADAILRDAVDVVKDLEAERDRYRRALEEIVGFDAFQGSPIAPRETPTTGAMRRLADEALR